MAPKQPKEKPQLALGLTYSENRIIRYLLFRAQRISLILDQLTFWRSPILWLLLFLNGILVYLMYPILTAADLPPNIPLFYYGLTTDMVLIPSNILIYVLISFIFGQLISIVVASKIYYRIKQLSLFILLSAILTTFLFGVTIYKSAMLTLPIP